ncbi:Cytochrome P450 704C1 (Cytochrome P450 CYPD) [Durusdinium trenchii]|uniref:Cytochrome P450 704C1 (Cytochrome P450 CYPD) n=1 Tax=Durusdinium trenchii TaxID=1381693 RepID=A0ABP0IT17_9DINO
MDSEVLAAKAGPSMAFFLVLAGFGGFLSSSGANVMAWSEFKRRSGKEWTRCQSMGFVFACFILNITGIGMFLASTALGGAVATVMPIQTGANLLGNMLWQTLLGMKYYTKSMRVGTIVLICAVMELSEIGPQEPSEWAPEEIQELMTKPVAIAWNCVMVLCTLISLYGVYRTLHLPMESSLKLFLFVSLVTFSTVIGASIGKLLGLVKGTVFALVAFLYFLDGVICLGGTVLANGHCDVSLFIPAQLSSQLVVNMITGYLVWGDAKYVAYPTSYLLVYALCIMGVYLNSPAMDVLGGLTRWYSIKHSRLSKGESCSNFGENVLRLLELWRRGGAAPEAYRDQLGAVLNRGLAVLHGLMAYGIFGVLQVFQRLWCGWRKARRMQRMLKDVPATQGVGHDQPVGWLNDLMANLHRLHDWRLDICKGLPLAKSLGFSWMPAPYLVVANDPQIVKHILKDEFNKYSKADTTLDPFFYYFEDFLGEGIFVVKHGLGSKDGGQEWSRMRKVSAQIFTRKNFNSMMQEVFMSKAESLRCFFNFTFDSIMSIFFGEECNTAEGVPNVYGKAFDMASVCLRAHSVKSMAPFLFFSTFLPWPLGGHHGGWARWFWDWSSPTYRRLKRCIRTLESEADRLVRKCQEDPTLGERRDLLALFLQGNFSPEFTKKMVLHLIIAGRDTTACLLSWMFYELTRHPEVQRQLHEEIMLKQPPGTPLDWKSLSASEMPYLNGVIYESLRLWPPVPFDLKMAFEDDVLPGGWLVPQFANVAFCPFNMGRDEERYPEALAFRPERWIPFTPPPQHEFPVFQAGPRVCLGQDMALFEAKTCAVELLRFCSFEMVPNQEVTYGEKITMDIKSNGKEEFWVTVVPWAGGELAASSS